ncbi:MAG: NUDIX hydrolase [Chitinophagaceae bacterium]|nr:NUDIX hydrolase [Chitinophagaceae bacterium]
MDNRLPDHINRIKAIADTGLLYSNNEFDKERYSELKEISLQLMSEVSGQDINSLKEYFPLVKDYPTAKVDIRGMVLSPDKKILLVKESLDGRWSLPGGWADVGYSPKENIIREFKEETGLDIVPEKLLAVFDKKMHPHPPQPFYIYKMVFYCTVISSKIEKGFDVLDVQYFDIADIPTLSEDRILKSQIELLYRKILGADFTTYVD